jgi:hypothetical protein
MLYMSQHGRITVMLQVCSTEYADVAGERIESASLELQDTRISLSEGCTWMVIFTSGGQWLPSSE